MDDKNPIVSEEARDIEDSLFLDLDGFEGPIDVLLKLARDQKVDLLHISILQLSRQYLSFIDKARKLSLDLAAEYLVIAAWLAYLKSRLLLPKEELEDDEPTGEEMAEALAFQLKRLGAMQDAAEKLLSRPKLGVDIHGRGMGEGLETRTNTKYNVALYDLLKAYGDINARKDSSTYSPIEFNLVSMEDAMDRMTKMLGKMPRKGLYGVWGTLNSFIPEDSKDKLKIKSYISSLLTAGLELAKQGKLEIKQDGLFRPIYIRAYDGNRDNG